jgi:fluoride exporter
MTILFVVLAGALGTLLRYLASLASGKWSVLLVNTVGSFIAGLTIGLSGDLQLIVAAGFCGGLTTFSTFSVHTVELAMKGKWNAAVSAVVANLVLGVIAAAAGMTLVS